MNGFIGLTFFITIVPVFIITMFIPYITRKTESFGVSIPAEVYENPEIKAMRRKYVYATGITGGIILVCFLFLAGWMADNPDRMSIGVGIALTVYIIATFIIYLVFHNKMKKRKAEEKWTENRPQQVAVDLDFHEKKLIYSNLWFAIPFLLSLATVVLTFLFYNRIPEQIPMRYDINGEVTNWAEKSYRTVMIMPAMQLYLLLLFIFLNTIIARAKQQTSAENPEESLRQNITFRRRWSAYIILTGTALTLLFAFIQYTFIFPVAPWLLSIVPLVFTGVVLSGAIILAFTTGQGGSRVSPGKDIDGNVIDRDDDRHWKLGQFYFNRQDPALFLEKRFGVGWTINFARPLAWCIFLLIILAAVGIPWLLGA